MRMGRKELHSATVNELVRDTSRIRSLTFSVDGEASTCPVFACVKSTRETIVQPK